ncbi:hypothetical protein [Azospirillum sp. TSO35-2]|uniref:hypothetical protein n=1 Tax=Azospirillum sp. TSO35-2 TaxID=716796 RepID=UPI000D609EF1|nr:hypothetical protein [Azospirillum sp. TSO35-2]PWC35988.1 hypothetical protein TSO352_12430 [Azospirillum sp. TSO35-2]
MPNSGDPAGAAPAFRPTGLSRRALLATAGSIGAALAVTASPLRAAAPIPFDRRINGDGAPWNRPVHELPRHPDSRSLVTMLWERGSDRPGNINLNLDESFAVHYAEDATSLYRIAVAWPSPLHGTPVPWNPGWRTPPGTDRKVIILDRASGREWNLFQAVFEGGRLSATNGSLVPGRYDTYEGVNPPSRGAGIQYAAMLVRAHEVGAGTIPHALAMSINNTDGRVFVPPAAKLEHPGPWTGIPEGTRFALAATDAEIDAWIGRLPTKPRGALAPAARTIARALRDYGWFITDTGGAASFEFEALVSSRARWDLVGLDVPMLAGGREYPRDLLDGLLTPDNIVALSPPAGRLSANE